MSRRAAIVFGRNPVPGRVKTRLAAVIGEQRAAALYKGFLLDTLRKFATLDCDVRLYLEHTEDPLAEELEPYDGEKLRQEGSDLGLRMAHALADTLRAGYAGALLMGSDLPTLPISIVASALGSIQIGRAVIVPVADGGYGVIGLAKEAPELFDMPFGHENVLDETIARADALNLQVRLLDPWYDIDTVDDLTRLVGDVHLNERDCPHTWRAIVAARLD